MGTGYFLLHRAYETGPGSVGLPWLCVFAAVTGTGGAAAFAGAIKTSALNWPEHRGTATAFPLAAFGLSAFFFSLLSSVAFEDDTGHFLLLSVLVHLPCASSGSSSFVSFHIQRRTLQYQPSRIEGANQIH